MIELYVAEYCHNCPEFEPYCEKLTVFEDYIDNTVATHVCCKHRHRCESIVKYLKGEINYEEKINKTDPIVPCDICNSGTWEECKWADSCPVRNQDGRTEIESN